MTPAQLDSLTRMHAVANGGPRDRATVEPEAGSVGDLLAFSRMPTA
jgi:hypothetical protein